MTTSNSWQHAWQATQQHPQQQLLLAFITLQGLSVEQVIAITPHHIDNGWLHLPDYHAPLVTQIQAILDAHPPESVFPIAPETIDDTLHTYALAADDAHRWLAGAVWMTSPDGKMIRELGLGEAYPILPLRFTFPFSVVERLQPDDELAESATHTLQAAADWVMQEILQPPPSLFARVQGVLLDGKTLFLLSGTAVSGLNLVNNLVLGRLLSPAAYGQFTLLVTLQLFGGLLPTASQTVAARYSARYRASNDWSQIHALLVYGRRWFVRIGLVIMAILLVLSPFLATWLQVRTGWLFVPIALAMPMFLLMGTERGVLQGDERYYWLSGSYVAEGLIRFAASLGLAWILLSAGRALDGAVWGVAQGMVMAWFVAWVALRGSELWQTPVADSPETDEWRSLFLLTLVSLLGQALITNSDFILVKTFFTTEQAGLYAAVSVIGRITYFAALPLNVLMVPMISRKQALDEPTGRLFLLLISGVGAVCFGLLTVSALFAPFILRVLYGAAYVDAAPLLAVYTLAASLFVLTNFVVTYRVALGRGDETWMPLVAGVLQIVGVIVFHDSLTQVILVQVVLMSLLLTGVSWRAFASSAKTSNIG